MACHRCLAPVGGPLGRTPNSMDGFGNAGEVCKVFIENEIAPLETKCKTTNEWVGEELVRLGFDVCSTCLGPGEG